MTYNELLRDFASRTMDNLEVIEKEAEQGKAFEVTQLVNSFLGVFIFAWQDQQMPNRINLGSTSLTKGDFDKIRHALAHFDIKPIDEEGEICGFRLSDRKGGKWEREFRVDELRTILEQMHDHLKRENESQ